MCTGVARLTGLAGSRSRSRLPAGRTWRAPSLCMVAERRLPVVAGRLHHPPGSAELEQLVGQQLAASGSSTNRNHEHGPRLGSIFTTPTRRQARQPMDSIRDRAASDSAAEIGNPQLGLATMLAAGSGRCRDAARAAEDRQVGCGVCASVRSCRSRCRQPIRKLHAISSESARTEARTMRLGRMNSVGGTSPPPVRRLR
jgi:hypothetical protein